MDAPLAGASTRREHRDTRRFRVEFRGSASSATHLVPVSCVTCVQNYEDAPRASDATRREHDNGPTQHDHCAGHRFRTEFLGRSMLEGSDTPQPPTRSSIPRRTRREIKRAADSAQRSGDAPCAGPILARRGCSRRPCPVLKKHVKVRRGQTM